MRPRGRAGDRGNLALELAILSPVLILFFLVLVVIGRIIDVKSQLDGAARDGARAASVARDPGAAEEFATQAVEESVGGSSWCLGDGPVAEVVAEKTEWAPGGMITVRVTCTTDLTGLNFFPIGDVVRVGEATASLDTYRRIICEDGEVCPVEEGAGE